MHCFTLILFISRSFCIFNKWVVCCLERDASLGLHMTVQTLLKLTQSATAKHALEEVVNMGVINNGIAKSNNI